MMTSPRRERREAGLALLVVVLILALSGAIVAGAISDSGVEAAASGRSRAATRAVYVADAGIQMTRSRLGQSPPNLTAVNVALAGGWNVQTRTRSETGPQPIAQSGTAGVDGYSINVGSGFTFSVYQVNVTSSSPSGATAEIEAKIARLSSSSGGY